MVEHVCEKSLALRSKIEIANLVRRRGESERDLRGRFLYGKQIMVNYKIKLLSKVVYAHPKSWTAPGLSL